MDEEELKNEIIGMVGCILDTDTLKYLKVIVYDALLCSMCESNRQ